MAVVTGINGAVSVGGTEIADVRNFSITHEKSNQEYGSSSTAPWKASAEGAEMWSGSIEAFLRSHDVEDGTDVEQEIDEGDEITLELTTHTGETISGSALVDSLDGYEVDINGSGLISVSINFTGKGTLTGMA